MAGTARGDRHLAPSSFLTALAEDGVCLLRQAVSESALALLDRDLPSSAAAGERLAGPPWLDRWVSAELLPALHAAGLSADLKPVRAILFNKTADGNWALGWHQDRTVAVR